MRQILHLGARGHRWVIVSTRLGAGSEKKEDSLKLDDIKVKDKELTSNKKRNKEKKRSINNLEQGNIIQRLNTEYDEKRSTLRNAILDGLNKGEKNEIKRRNNSAVKKNINK